MNRAKYVNDCGVPNCFKMEINFFSLTHFENNEIWLLRKYTVLIAEYERGKECTQMRWYSYLFFRIYLWRNLRFHFLSWRKGGWLVGKILVFIAERMAQSELSIRYSWKGCIWKHKKSVETSAGRKSLGKGSEMRWRSTCSWKRGDRQAARDAVFSLFYFFFPFPFCP